ncbi:MULTISPECIES: tyrosine-type recombinase/integrase [unclassified Mycolicibacterium]|uniref:tyrosine-type recombinase/integrase n=1 Tax=unclassified Mycolicibacterium TaxID=2636767 RepID=UPI001FD528A7|nr:MULTISPECIES: tyrosine-type recombinase/integrase [unclassified Mycolicibacterium]
MRAGTSAGLFACTVPAPPSWPVLAAYCVNVRYVRGEPVPLCHELHVAMRSSHCYVGGADLLEGGFTVRRIGHAGGRQSYWIFTPSGELHRPSLDVLTRFGPSTQETYAYSLVDHLNWLHVNRKPTTAVTLDDLRRYMNGLTGAADGVYGVPWRAPKQKPLGAAAAANVATIVKVYYLALAANGQASGELVAGFETAPRTSKHKGSRQVTSNPLAPRKSARRPRFLADAVVASLFEPSVLTTARDLMIVTWLHDGGMRVGGMCGLRFCDLHLSDNHPCGQRADPHIHIVGRDDNPNRARAKAYASAGLSVDGYVLDGVIRAVSPAMISTFYGYLLDEYHPIAHLVDHEQVLVHVQGSSPGRALSTSAVRKMLRRSCERAGLNARITPHAFRHRAAAALYAATDFNAEMVAQEFGWSSPSMVTELYGKSANREAMQHLHRLWETAPGLTTGTSGDGAQA